MLVRQCVAAVAAAALFPFALAGGRVSEPAQTAKPGAPKLVVVLVVDQMRSDYLDRHAAAFTGGFKRLMSEGAWFKEAAYPYLATVTCPGHSTIGTGAFPYRHGMILNEWVDRKDGRITGCTADPSVQIITYAPVEKTATGESARNLLVPTLADRIRERANGRVVTMSIKPRSAIGLAGRQGDAVVWFDDRGSWATSTAYAKEPVPFIRDFVTAHPFTADVEKVWDRMLDPAKYKNQDEAVGERPQTGWTAVFPHPLAPERKPDAAFRSRWKASPFGDDYLGRMAAAASDAVQLGRGKGIDFLGVSFSNLDSVGHAFGPESHEVQDMVLRLDRTIGALLEHLDRTVGRGSYVVGFTADHGVAPLPEQSGGGRQAAKQVLAAINNALTPFLGAGDHAVVTAYTDIYLAAGVADFLKREPKAREAVLGALRALPGVQHAFTADELEGRGARTSRDQARRAAALSHHEERGGDIVIAPRQFWILSSSATTHGTHHAYDQRVPLIFHGAGVRAGVRTSAATPADLAPTLAALAGVRFDAPDGHLLDVR
jgi:hypothetical protein